MCWPAISIRRGLPAHIVLVGTSAAGVINDLQATPLARAVPGVDIHAQLLDEILQGEFLTRPDWAVGAEILFALVVGAGLIFVLPRIGALPSAVLGGVSVAAALGGSWFAFKYAHLLIDPVYPWAVITLVYLVASLLGYLRTEARQREIRSAFSRYMSPHYVEELAAHPEKLVLGGEMRIMTIMFCDIRGFTSRAEGMDAHTPDAFHEHLSVADDRDHHRAKGHDRQIYRRLHHGVLERPARRSRPRQERGARGPGDAPPSWSS